MKDVAEQSTEEILQRLKTAGFKFTGKRREIVDLFVKNPDRYLSAKEVYELIQDKFPNVSVDTIYRTLALLVDQRVLETMEFTEDAARYRLTCHRQHHHHMVCLGCGRTFPLDDCPMDELSEKMNGFQVVSHRFEVYGYCRACRQAS